MYFEIKEERLTGLTEWALYGILLSRFNNETKKLKELDQKINV